MMMLFTNTDHGEHIIQGKTASAPLCPRDYSLAFGFMGRTSKSSLVFAASLHLGTLDFHINF